MIIKKEKAASIIGVELEAINNNCSNVLCDEITIEGRLLINLVQLDSIGYLDTVK